MVLYLLILMVTGTMYSICSIAIALLQLSVKGAPGAPFIVCVWRRILLVCCRIPF